LGLFHNCGIPILMQKFKNYIEIVEKSYQNPDGLVQQVEQRELDIDHCVVGHHLCDLWNMDELIGDAVLYHHAGPEFFEQEKNGPLKDLVATLMLAEHLVEIHRIVGHNKEDHGWKRVSKHVKKQLNIVTQDDYNDIRNYVFDVALQK
ncbi:MAG: HDOD domain-containing protein, partial [Gammaproteobacteria bacterium]|nr:HDOD domain-containing protein [Gammaproteobacteria bacterium]